MQQIFPVFLMVMGALIIAANIVIFFKAEKKQAELPVLKIEADFQKLINTEYHGRGLSGFPTTRKDTIAVFGTPQGQMQFFVEEKYFRFVSPGVSGVLTYQGKKFLGFEPAPKQ